MARISGSALGVSIKGCAELDGKDRYRIVAADRIGVGSLVAIGLGVLEARLSSFVE